MKESMEQRKYFNLIFMDVQVVLCNAESAGHELTMLSRCPTSTVYKVLDS